MIILEGPDQIGKTTVACKLAAMIATHRGVDVSRAYRHMGKPADDFDHVLGYINALSPVVQDRFHLGSLVYGLLLGNGRHPTQQQMLYVQRWLRWSGAIVIIMYSETQWYRDRFTVRDELYTREQIIESNTCFSMLANTTNNGEPFANISYNVATSGFPSDSQITEWFNLWKNSWIV